MKYDVAHQRALSQHRDSSSFSFSVLLNDPSDFKGGGTYYAAFDRVVHTNRGDILVHHGSQVHGGVAVSDGVRYLLIGFLGLKGDCEGHDTANSIAGDLMDRLEDDPDHSPAQAQALAREVAKDMWHGFPTASGAIIHDDNPDNDDD